jgi:hypothetical protein
MKIIMIFVMMHILLSSCQQKTQNYRFDKKSLKDHYQTKNFNLLILWDHRVHNQDEQKQFDSELKKYLTNTLNNNQVRILIAGLDGNPPHYFLSSHNRDLPDDYSSLFYSVDKLNLSQFERRYNPNISILKSARELIQSYSFKKFFIPQNDFMVIIVSTQDDENYAINMQGQKYQDRLEDDVQKLIKLNVGQWSIDKGMRKDFSFNQLRIFVLAPTSNCHTNFISADKLFYATTKINSHYTQTEEDWKRDNELFNICNLNFKSYFDNIFQKIEERYEVKIK